MTAENKLQPQTAIVPQVVAPTAIVPTSEDELFEALEKRNRLLERILSYAISVTHKEQWTDLGGKPWPTGPACEAMARRCAVSWDKPESEKRNGEDERGKYYAWTYRARFTIGRDEITAEGHCSSRDSFLGTGTKEEATREIWEVDEGNIRQAAYTNMVVNGVTRLLGVRNLSWDRLEALLGMKREDVARVEYDHGAKGGGRGKSADDLDVKFGKNKGKKLSECADADIRWLIGCWEKDLADPEKKKFHANSQRSIEIANAMLAARSAAQASGDAPAAGGDAKPYDRILAIAAANKKTQAEAHAWLKEHGRATPASITNEDVAAFEKWASDVPF